MRSRLPRLATVLLLVAVLLATGLTQTVQAEGEELAPTVQCGRSDLTQFSAAVDGLPAGSALYAKTTTPAAQFAVDAYFETYEPASCSKLGTATIQNTTWTKIGTLGAGMTGAGSLSVQGEEAGADAFAAVATVMVVPPGLCEPVTNCEITYKDLKGTLQPKTVSVRGDFLTVQLASPVDSVGFSKVEYFSDDQFLYRKTELERINRNYLAGGEQVIKRVVYLNDGQTFTTTQTIDMGPDSDATLLIRSWFYRQRGEVKVLLLLSIFLILPIILIGIIRYIHRRHIKRVDHGLDHYKHI
ncbi:MAG: hypothetical protein QG553_538 [Patescibacteria group bacterium]|nr:hypothetical protein [Patescibacteria group bacterium]